MNFTPNIQNTSLKTDSKAKGTYLTPSYNEESLASNTTPSLKSTSATSRGSSPSRRKLVSESSHVSTSNSKVRSPIVSRKVLSGSGGNDSNLSTPTYLSHISSSNRSRFAHFTTEEMEKEGESSSNDTSGHDSSTPILRTNEDDNDGSWTFFSPPNQQQKTKEYTEQLQSKIHKTAQLIKEEQSTRDENVNEYLKLSSNADKNQKARIKTVFEKKNQKSAAQIQHLQKKLEVYRSRLKSIEQHGIHVHRQPKEVLRDVGHGLKKGLMGKPKEFAHLIKNKFGSADNIKELGDEEKDEDRSHTGSATLPPNSGLLPISSVHIASKIPLGNARMGSSGGACSSGGGKLGSDEGSEMECNSSMTSESVSAAGGQQQILYSSPRDVQHSGDDFGAVQNSVLEVSQELTEENSRLREEIELIKQTMTSEVNNMYESLMEEKVRYDRLEEQVNDLTELHQNEMENLKTAIKDVENMEEKIQYKNEENIKDLHEMLESCQAKIYRMEHQQAQQQQQFLTLEGLENSNARMLIVKLINILLTLLQVFLLVVATVAGILTPLLQTRGRLLTTLALIIFTIFFYVQFHEIKICFTGLKNSIARRLVTQSS